MSKRHRAVLHHLTGLTQHLQDERSRFASAPILLLQSKPASEKFHSKSVESACRNVEFLVSQRLGFQTVVAQHTGAPFPTLLQARQNLDMAQRVGAETVICVGSGGVMDLCKTMQALETAHRPSKSKLHSFIFIPATYPACIAAASSHALILDPTEEVLNVCPSSQQQQRKQPNGDDPETLIVTLESKFVDYQHQRETALLASLAVGLDGLYQGHRDEATDAIMNSALQALDMDQKHELIQRTALTAGEILSYGDSLENRRSIPLALAASLTPRFFPHNALVSVMASFVPALCELVKEKAVSLQGTWSARIGQHLTSIPCIVTSEANTELLLKSVHESMALWNCFDIEDDNVYRRVLKDHVLL